MNPQSTALGWTPARRRRWSWLRSSFADVAGSGHMPSREDIDALPDGVRDQALEISKRAVEAFEKGEQGKARELARDGFSTLEQEIHPKWRPPAMEMPSSELLDRIQGRL